MIGLLLNPRVLLAIALAVFLASTYLRGHQQGAKGVREEWALATARATTAALAASENNREQERMMQRARTEVDNAYQKEKARRVIADGVTADSLRRLNAALARGDGSAKDTATAARTDGDPRDAIVAECASSLGRLDKEARGLAGQIVALQGYVAGVCVSK